MLQHDELLAPCEQERRLTSRLTHADALERATEPDLVEDYAGDMSDSLGPLVPFRVPMSKSDVCVRWFCQSEMSATS